MNKCVVVEVDESDVELVRVCAKTGQSVNYHGKWVRVIAVEADEVYLDLGYERRWVKVYEVVL